MLDQDQSDAPQIGCAVPQDSGGPADPGRIIFREIDIDCQNNVLNIAYLNDGQPPLSMGIDEFIATKIPYPPTARGIAQPTSPLDLNCKEDCFIVFMLSSEWNWHFAPSGTCFTTKKDMKGKYSDLVHVLSDGTRITGGRPLPDGCRLLYFRASCKNESYKDGFNLIVELRLGTWRNPQTGEDEVRRTKLVIDPDIRNPGGSSLY